MCVHVCVCACVCVHKHSLLLNLPQFPQEQKTIGHVCLCVCVTSVSVCVCACMCACMHVCVCACILYFSISLISPHKSKIYVCPPLSLCHIFFLLLPEEWETVQPITKPESIKSLIQHRADIINLY